MRKSHIFALTFIVLMSCVSAFAADVQQAAAPAGVVNINTADAAQLALLPRVGMKAAQRVVEYRTQHGPFAKKTDLMQVKGFGEKSFERLNPYITLEGKSTLTSKVQGPRKARSSKSSRRSQPTSTASK